MKRRKIDWFHVVWWIILVATALDVLLIYFNLQLGLPDWKVRTFQLMGAATMKALWLFFSAKKKDSEHLGG